MMCGLMEKKVSGMMINSSSMGKELIAHIGIGINVNEDFRQHEDLELRNNATSLFNCIGKILCREWILAQVCNKLEYFLSIPMSELLKEYKTHDILCGRNVIVMPKKKENPERIIAVANEFNENGNLVVTTTNNEKLILSAEEVTIRPEDIAKEFLNTLIVPIDIETIINGNWKNQSGSKVTFCAQSEGKLTGKYFTAVGNADVEHDLNGSWCCLKDGALISFTVCWTELIDPSKSKSTTSWSGKLFVHKDDNSEDKKGDNNQFPCIVTTWILTSDTKMKDLWESTLINQDIFSKVA